MSNKCEILHEKFNKLRRFNFPFNKEDIPQNGIYILFENGERAHGVDRIVRIGTHTGENQLRSRLRQHFLNANKDRSIFRKNIGRTLLNKNNDEYIDIWELDLTSRSNKEKYSTLIDSSYQELIEIQVSNIIQHNFSFSVIEVPIKENRLFYEARIISEVSNCTECKPSENWFGRSSPKQKICKSGLWQVNELYKENFENNEFEEFLSKIKDFI